MTYYKCKKCGWEGEVKTKPRCLVCSIKAVRAWEKRNPEKARQYRRDADKRFRQNDPKGYNMKRRRNRKKETNALNYQKRLKWLLAGDVTRIQLIEIYEKFNGKCVYCDRKVKPRFTVTDPRGFDHLNPRVKGGRHTAFNIVVCCRKCNELKGEKEEYNGIKMDAGTMGSN